MLLEDKLLEDLKVAMKTNNTVQKNTVQLIRATILTEKKNKQRELTDLEVEDLIMKEKKKRLDTLAQIEQTNRTDLIQQTQQEIMYISNYLPQPISEYELEQEIAKIIKETGATSKTMGPLIKQVKDKFGNRTDGRTISIIVKKLLNIG